MTDGSTAAALRGVQEEHSQLRRRLRELVGSIGAAAQSGEGVSEAASALLSFLGTELLPHSSAEEATVYAAASSSPATELLSQVMLAEHRWMEHLVREYQLVHNDPLRGSAKAEAIMAMFEIHASNEERFLLPAVFEGSEDQEGLARQLHDGVEAVRAAYGDEDAEESVAHWFG